MICQEMVNSKFFDRVDIDSPPHRNPDGTMTSRNHIHIYRETDHDTGNLPWAYDLATIMPVKLDQNGIDFMTVFLGSVSIVIYL